MTPSRKLFGGLAAGAAVSLVLRTRRGWSADAVGAVHRRGRSARTARRARPGEPMPAVAAVDALRVLTSVVLPTVAKGVIIRRRRMVALAERMDLDRRAVRTLQTMRDRHGEGPLLVGPAAGRHWAVVLDPEHVTRVLDGTPEPFATVTFEKRAALAHFEPKNVLLSHGEDRAERRRFNEEVLDYGRPLHHLAQVFAGVVRDEAQRLLASIERDGTLTWNRFAGAWFAMVRRVVFGDAARDDVRLSRLMDQLRRQANWAFLRPQTPERRRRLLAGIRRHLARAEPGSLAAAVAAAHVTRQTAPEHQVPQWLFAFDPAGMATFRALALLATHPAPLTHAREEAAAVHGSGAPHELPFLRASVLESLRLWPTAPFVLRETTRPTEWERGVMPAPTTVLIYAPYFHRDDRRVPFADRFAPEVWLQDSHADARWGFVPFSLGSGRCPGRDLVLLLASTMLAEILGGHEVRLLQPSRMDPDRPLPGTLNHFSLRFVVA